MASKIPIRPHKDELTAPHKTKHPIFFSRAISALEELETVLPTELIDEASAAPTNFMVLLEALKARSLATEFAVNEPLTIARLRGVERQHNLVEQSGGMLKGERVAKLLGISRQAVDKRRRQNRLIGLTQGRRGYAYPIWQFHNGKTLSNLEKVLDQLRDHDPWMQLTFFLNANDRLEGSSPLEMLRSGKVEPVLEAATSYGEHGAA
jgi:biotin operon repressor